MTRWLVVAALAASACDPAAKAADGEAAPAERRSKQHDSCGRTADCEAPLRCVASECRGATESVAGELEAALAVQAAQAGQAGQAAQHFTAAVAHYDAEHLAVPAHLLCGQGRALAAASGDAKQGEQAARLLHRCLLATPPGAPLHQHALDGLAALVDRGLDPAAVARPEPADAYLTRTAAPPALDAVRVSVEGDGKTRYRGYRELVTRLGADPAVAAGLAPCWQAYTQATQQPTLRVTLRVRHSYRLDDNDDFERATVEIAELAEGDEALRGAASCVRASILPAAEEVVRKLAEESRWEASITLTAGG